MTFIKYPPNTPIVHALTHETGGTDQINVTLLGAIPIGEKGAPSGVAELDALGLLPTAQLPPLSITKVFVVASEIDQLALVTEEGDAVVRTDQNKTYFALNDDDPKTMADYQEVLYPGGGLVTSVNTFVGDVVLGYSDVGAEQAGAVSSHNTSNAAHDYRVADAATVWRASGSAGLRPLQALSRGLATVGTQAYDSEDLVLWSSLWNTTGGVEEHHGIKLYASGTGSTDPQGGLILSTTVDGTTWVPNATFYENGIGFNQPQVNTQNALGVTSVPSVSLANNTVAVAGTPGQQYSPSMMFRGQGWNTLTSASEPIDWQVYVKPVPNNPYPTSYLTFDTRNNLGAWATKFNVYNSGEVANATGSYTALYSGTSFIGKSQVSDGVAAIACKSYSSNALNTSGAKIHSFYKDAGTTEVASIGRLGMLSLGASSQIKLAPNENTPTACVAGTPTAGGSVDAGTHSYKVTFVTLTGESDAGTVSNIITTAANKTVPLTAIPVGSSYCTARNIYRTVAGDAGNHKYVGQLAGNVTTTYSDILDDASLGVDAPVTNTTTNLVDSTSGKQLDFGISGVRAVSVETDKTFKTAGGRKLSYATVSATPYNLLVTDEILYVAYTATGATSIVLPTAQLVAGRVIKIVDTGGLATTNNITISTEGAEKISGQDTYVININYSSVSLTSNGTHWFVY